MVLEILLGLLILCFISGGILTYIWWKKYGKKIFKLIETISSLKNSIPQVPKMENKNNVENLHQNLNMLKDLMGNLNNLQKNVKLKK